MQSIRAYFDGTAFVPVDTANIKRNQSAVITLVDDDFVKEEKDIDKYFGCLSKESYDEIMEALKDTEQVDINEW